MQAPFPHHYEVRLRGERSAESGALGGGEKLEITVGAPPQFGGKAQFWSPEEMLLGAIAACTMTTFFSLVEKNPIEILKYTSHIEGVLNKVKTGILFERIILYVNLEVKESDTELGLRLLNAAKKYCVISNILKLDVNFFPVVTGNEEMKYSEAV